MTLEVMAKLVPETYEGVCDKAYEDRVAPYKWQLITMMWSINGFLQYSPFHHSKVLMKELMRSFTESLEKDYEEHKYLWIENYKQMEDECDP